MIIRTIGSLTSAYVTTSSPGRFSLAFQSQGKAPWGRGCLCYHKLMTFHTMRLKPFFYCSYFGLLWWWWWRWEGYTLVLHLSYMPTLCCRNPCLRLSMLLLCMQLKILSGKVAVIYSFHYYFRGKLWGEGLSTRT